MGLCVLPKLKDIIAERKQIFEVYDSLLNGIRTCRNFFTPDFIYNYGYYPVVFESEERLLKVRAALLEKDISTRRYFYPSLNELPFLEQRQCCEISESISKRVLSLPLYYGLANEDVEKICNIINACI